MNIKTEKMFYKI